MDIEKGKQLATAWLKGSPADPTPASPALMLSEQRLAHEYLELLSDRDDLARALFRIRALTIRGRGDPEVARIALSAVLHIDETPLMEAAATSPSGATGGA